MDKTANMEIYYNLFKTLQYFFYKMSAWYMILILAVEKDKIKNAA